MQPDTIQAEPECRICGWKKHNKIITKDHNRRITNEDFIYYQCNNCKMIILHPVPIEIGKYYQSEYYLIPKSIEQLKVESESEKYKLEMLRTLTSTGKILDVGAGYGRFVFLAKCAGYNIDAIEFNEDCCRFIQEVIGTRAITHDRPAEAIAGLGSYDVITCWHVLEHLADPMSVMEAAEKHLNPGGWLIVAMPNPESFQLRVFGQFWAHFDAPRHLQLIPFQTLYNKLVLECGMQTIAFTTRDQGSLEYNQLGWTWSMRNCFRIRGASRAGKLLSTLCSWYEQVGKQGSCYTAIFKKPDEAV